MTDTALSLQETKASRELLGWLWHGYLRRHLPLLSLAILFMILEGAMLGAISWLMQPMFDDVFVGGDSRMLYVVGGLVVGIFLVRAVSSVGRAVILAWISQQATGQLRMDLLDRLMQLDSAFHQAHPPGYLIQRVQTDVGAITQVWQAVIIGTGRDLMGLIVLLGVAISVDPLWALLAIIGVPLLVLPAGLATKFVRRVAQRARDLGASLSTRLDEVFHGIIQVKLNALEGYQAAIYRRLTRDLIRMETRAAFGTSALPAMIDVISGLGFMAVILYGGSEIISGEKTIGQFMTFFTAMGFAFDPMRRLGNISGLWQQAAASIERVKSLTETPVTLCDPAAPRPAPAGVPSLEFQDVRLSYGETEVLRGLSLIAEPGKTTALVGPSGAGKTTVFNLLTRLVDPDAGQVLVGGVPAGAMTLGDLRGLFSVVTQDALLFDDTLRENIVLGRKVSAADLQNALEAAHVADFLSSLPDGVETAVGPRGTRLSGGQRQRVVIARALLRDTPILLLDEATSALDAASEQKVQAALERLAAGRTTLVIAHRLSTIRSADRIYVMDKGRAVDSGTHSELMDRGGIYAHLHRLQNSSAD